MIDSLTSSIAAILNNKRDTDFQTKVLRDTEILRELSAAVANALCDIRSLKCDEDSETNAFYDNCLTGILDIYEAMIGGSREDGEESKEQDLSDLGQNIAAEMKAVGEETDKENTGLLKTVSKSLTSLVKVATSELKQGMQMSKLLSKVEETVGEDKDKTKTIDGEEKTITPEGVKNAEIDPTKINMNGVAKSMAKAAADALNPIKLIKAFFMEVLPYVILFGLLVYGFITGYLDGDVYDFILVMGGIIIAAFMLYIAYQYIKANIMFAFKITCELAKLSMALAVQAFQFIATAIIVAAFLLVAAIFLIIIAAALYFIIKAVADLVESVGKVLVGLTKVVLDFIVDLVKAIFWGFLDNNKKDDDEDKKKKDNQTLEALITASIIPKMDEIIDAIKNSASVTVEASGDDSLNSIITSGFASFTNSIDDLSNKLIELSTKNKDVTFDVGANALFGYFNSISENVKAIADMVSKIVDNNAAKESEIIKQVVTTTLEQHTNAMSNNYQIADGTAVLKNGTAYAQSKDEEGGESTDLGLVVAQLGKIVTHLNNIYQTEKQIAEGGNKSFWSGLFGD